MVVEARRLGMRFAWAYVALGMLVAFACAFPLFLFVREGALTRDRARCPSGAAARASLRG
jgi:hypothetical protein